MTEQNMTEQENTQPMEAEQAQEVFDATSKWYCVQVMSGQENKVVESLTNRRTKLLNDGKDCGLDEILLPKTSTVERRDRKEVVKTRLMYPGYVFVRARITDAAEKTIPEHWEYINDTKGVIRIMFPALEPAVVEAMKPSGDEAEKPKPQLTWHIGDRVVFTEGRFENLDGVVESVDENKQSLKVSISMFGRNTICEAEYWQVRVPDEDESGK